jgi:hypothetical protein
MRSSLRVLPRYGTRIPLQAPISPFHSRPLLPFSTTRLFSTSNILQNNKTKSPNQKEQEKEEDFDFNNQIDNAIGEAKELQARTPWHREGSEKPPVRRRSAGAMTKGLFYIHLLWVLFEEDRLIDCNRQTPHHPLPPPKAHPPPHNP